MIGVGCNIWSSAGGLGPAWLLSAISSAAGEAPTDLWLPEYATLDGSSNVTGLPGLVGGSLSPASASLYKVRLGVTGRSELYSADTVQKALKVATGDCRTVLAVLHTPTLPVAVTQYVIDAISGTSEVMALTAGTSNWYPSAGGFTRYRDGALSADRLVLTGLHSYIATRATTFTGLCAGNDPGLTTYWKGGIALVARFASTLDATKSAAVSAIAARYYRL